MELTLFVIIGAVAVVAAAMMLISENAVHSALFLIVNFACIAFFFLMLHAPFLAMVQITVYAGAIMVLFLFVIMLLGADRLVPEQHPRFPWLMPAAIILALIFVITASLAIVRGDVDLTEPSGEEPRVRVVNALDEPPSVTVYIGETLLVDGLAFRDSSDFETWDTGQYTARLFAPGADPAVDTPLDEQVFESTAGQAVSLVAASLPDGVRLVPAYEDISQFGDKKTLRVTAVNALHGQLLIDVMAGNASDDLEMLINDIAVGTASESQEIEDGTVSVRVYGDGDRNEPLVELEDEQLVAYTTMLWVFAERLQSENSWENVTLTLKTDSQVSFGGPEFVGQQLFSRYVLPFEMVSLVLLAAMIGAIVLTHESLGTRRQVVRRLANPPAGLEQPITRESGK